MNCIIVADKSNCLILQEFVVRSSSLNLTGTYNDSTSARNQLSKRQDIDLVFLDLDIMEMDCFDFISSLTYKPNIILLSSGCQNALRAFDFDVTDYLLKPVTYSRFFKAIDKAIRYFIPKETISTDNEVFIKKGSELVRLKLKDIIFIEAVENYITLNTVFEKYTIHYTMKAIEDQLPSSIFIRVQRSYIINKTMIQTIEENSLDLKVGDKFKSIPVGKSFRNNLLNDINLMTR